MIDAGFSGQGAPGMAIVMALASLFDDFDDLYSELTPPCGANRSARSSIEIDSGDSAIGFASLYVSMHGDCDRIAREIGRSTQTAARLRKRFGLPTIPRQWTAAHDIAFERILAATDIDLAKWATGMHQYWKARPSARPMSADLAEFLRISET